MSKQNGNETNKGGKVYTRAVFLMCLNDSDYYEPIAIFPDIYWDVEHKNWMCYQHIGQHCECCKAFARLDCIPPRPRDMKAVERLKYELEHLSDPYCLEVIDAREWLASNAELAMRLAKNSKHYEQELETESKKQEDNVGEQLDFLDELLDDDRFYDTQKAIGELVSEEFAELKGIEGLDFEDINDGDDTTAEGETTAEEKQQENTPESEEPTAVVA